MMSMLLLHGASFKVIAFALSKFHKENSGGTIDLGLLSQIPKYAVI
jgi:hypothetical protein